MELFSSWTGSDFLLFYAALLSACTFAAWGIPLIWRSAGRRGTVSEAEDIALLIGGRDGHADSVIADLYARGGLRPYDRRTLFVSDSSLPASYAGQVLLAQAKPFSRRDARRLLAGHAERIAARLRREGLLLRSDAAARMCWVVLAPFGVLFFIGLYRQRMGSAVGEPTEYLVILLALTAGLAAVRYARFDQRTHAGIALVEQLRKRSDRIRSAPRAEEASLAVALFGTGVLIGTPWQPVHAMRQKGTSDSGCGAGGSDGGDGGCGGCGG